MTIKKKALARSITAFQGCKFLLIYSVRVTVSGTMTANGRVTLFHSLYRTVILQVLSGFQTGQIGLLKAIIVSLTIPPC